LQTISPIVILEAIMFYFLPNEETLQKYDDALNPNTPQEALERLATDEDKYTRFCVAKNPNVAQKVLEVLATDKSFTVRARVAMHPNRTELIERLVYMTEKVYENKETPIESLDTFDFYRFLEVASIEELEGNYLRPETLTQILTTK
jgi:hypothetical protein